ncbi:MAG: phospho-sugar mutase, partial [Acutalibacteraceae bacterium]
DGLEDIYRQYGYFLDRLDSFVLKGKDGAERITQLMVYFRENGKNMFDSLKSIVDYSLGVGDLPKENVLRFIFLDGSWLAVRPSGTEPKIKVYYSIQDQSREKAQQRFDEIKAKIDSIIK